MGEDSQISIKISEDELVERSKCDKQAFSHLYDIYFPKIYGFVIKRVGHQQVAEDIVSVVFIKVYANINKYKKRKCSFSAWIYKITNNTLIDYYRKTGKRKSVPLEGVPEVNFAVDPIDIEAIQDAKTVRVVIEKLSPKYQQILNLKFFAQLDNGEIAEVLDVTANNAGVLIYRALQSFKKHYIKYV